MRASTFADHMATCNTAGSCFVTNDSPFPFVGSVSVRVLNVLTGVSVNQTLEPVSLPAGPKLSHWFCAEKPHASVSSGDVEDDDDASSSTLLRATAATPGTKHTTQGADFLEETLLSFAPKCNITGIYAEIGSQDMSRLNKTSDNYCL